MRPTLLIIVLAQFLCTSVWFAGNAVVTDLVQSMQLHPGFIAHLTSAVQFGFIIGTLIYAILTIADRFSPTRVFFISSILAAVANLLVCIPSADPIVLLVSRSFTGFFLAGIYPVGMKIASDHFKEGLGKSLGFLVGALVLGTALPHLLKSYSFGFYWKNVFYATSILSVIGGLLILLFVGDGPHRKAAGSFKLTAFFQGFRNKEFRSAAFGYFGHMWELYTLWALIPSLVVLDFFAHGFRYNISILTFLLIASGAPACMISGLLARKFGAKNIATIALLLSCLCCLLSPLFIASTKPVLIPFLFFWCMVVVADSPMFSSLVAQHAPPDSRGSALTIVNCIGFTITIVSIQLMTLLGAFPMTYVFMFLAIGPILGLFALLWKRNL